MQSKTFSRVWLAIVALGTAWMLIYIGGKAREAVPFPAMNGPATSTSAMAASSTPLPLPTRDVRAPRGAIRADVAADDASRELGLGGRASLSKDTGMLFVFPNAGAYGFWMKGMQFPIDLAWIGADKRVIGVVPGMLPGSYPQIYYPESPISYVLELAAGGLADYGIATGTQLVF